MIFRIRLAVALLSFAVVGLELALMRILSLRFWYYFAAMVISVALLGFGFSGTLLTLGQRRLKCSRGFWLPALAFAAALSMLVSAWGVQQVPLDIHYLAWSFGAEWLHILEIELLMLLPFLLSGGFLGLVLMDRSDRIHGHYAANLIGSGAGALVSVMLMSYVSTARTSGHARTAGLRRRRGPDELASPAGCVAGVLIWRFVAGGGIFFSFRNPDLTLQKIGPGNIETSDGSHPRHRWPAGTHRYRPETVDPRCAAGDEPAKSHPLPPRPWSLSTAIKPISSTMPRTGRIGVFWTIPPPQPPGP